MPASMRAVVKPAAGAELELQDIPVPDVGPGDVRIDVSFCGICGSDLHIEDDAHPSSPPVVLGHEFSGIVDAVGTDVEAFEPGDRIGFRHSWSPFPGVDGDGGFAEYMTAPADVLCHIPDDLSLELATLFEPVRPPLTIVRDVAELSAGERVVVSGPGPMGLLVTAAARLEAPDDLRVLGTEHDKARRLPLARELGADDTQVFGEDSLAAIADEPPDVWFETSGAPPAIEAAVDHVRPGGRVVCSGLGEGPWNVDMRRVAYRNLSIHGQWGGKDQYIPVALEAIRSGELQLERLISDIVPLTDWERGFELARSQQGIKVLLRPEQA